MVRIISQKYELVPVAKLRPHPLNSRRGNVDGIRRSIRANKFYGVVVAQAKTGTILVGKHRWEAAKAEGLAEIPTLRVSVSDEEALRILLADNRLNDLADYDNASLAATLSAILQSGAALEGTGFEPSDLDELLAEVDSSALADVADDESGNHRKLGDRKAQIKAVLYAEQVALFERAMQATGEMNRGEALLSICRAYLDRHAAPA